MTAFSLKLDAIVSGANGAAYLVAANPIGDLLGLSPSLLRGIGAFFVVFAAAVWLAAARRADDALVVTGIAAANVAWALGSLAAAVAGWGTPTTVGTVWIVAQALVVAGFAELQLLGLRRRPAALAR
jgi:hypothetical protein